LKILQINSEKFQKIIKI